MQPDPAAQRRPLLTCPGGWVSSGGWGQVRRGGRSVGGRVCARAPGLTSVRDPRVGSGAGDVMFDGVIPLGEACCGRSIFLGRPPEGCRQQGIGSRPQRICVSEDSARTEQELVQAGWSASSLLFEWPAARLQSARALTYAVRRRGPATFTAGLRRRPGHDIFRSSASICPGAGRALLGADSATPPADGVQNCCTRSARSRCANDRASHACRR